MNDLEKYFAANTGRMINKWKHYLEIYDRHFSRFRGSDVCLVEFGVYQGGSLQMWKDYFGPAARIVGIDINPHCKACEEEQVEIIIGDQEDREFLKSLKRRIPRIDILIDDGGHTMGQQIRTFEELFPHIDSHGVYLCEDLHSSYWSHYGGGYKRRGSFIEFSKNLIDQLNAWQSESRRLQITDFTRSAFSMHFYGGVLVVEKRPMEEPQDMKSGSAEIPYVEMPPRLRLRLERRLRLISDKLKEKAGGRTKKAGREG